MAAWGLALRRGLGHAPARRASAACGRHGAGGGDGVRRTPPRGCGCGCGCGRNGVRARLDRAPGGRRRRSELRCRAALRRPHPAPRRVGGEHGNPVRAVRRLRHGFGGGCRCAGAAQRRRRAAARLERNAGGRGGGRHGAHRENSGGAGGCRGLRGPGRSCLVAGAPAHRPGAPPRRRLRPGLRRAGPACDAGLRDARGVRRVPGRQPARPAALRRRGCAAGRHPARPPDRVGAAALVSVAGPRRRGDRRHAPRAASRRTGRRCRRSGWRGSSRPRSAPPRP